MGIGWRKVLAVFGCCGISVFATVSSIAQDAVPVVAAESPQKSPQAVAAPAQVQGQKPEAANAPPTPSSGGPASTGAPPADASAEGKKKNTATNEPSAPIQRSSSAPESADPKELKIRPNPEGKISFNFQNQPWPAILDWIAEVSGMSLDWQELPGDYLNLATQQPYTVPEARDLINRHLLARGFTMLEQEGVLSVVNLSKLNPGLVPRVEPAELESRRPHEFVKTSFPLEWLIAETAVEELKPMLSAHGKLTPLKSTNRLEAIDVVVNLREIHRLLNQEQAAPSQERLVREYVLQYARAADVKEQLEGLLGVEKKSNAPMTPEQMQMMQQQAQMRMQQNGGKPPAAEPPKSEVFLVVNARRNSLLAHAAPDKLAIVDQAVKVLDVATHDADSFTANINRMQVYRLVSLDPEPLAKTLQEIGGLEPNTRLEVDKSNRSIIAYASLADHVTIRSVISKLDGSGRKFEVIPLRRLEADYVAGSIEFMMGTAEKESSNSRSSFYGFDYFSRRNNDDSSKADKFKVDADTINNRLLLWANEIELQEVVNLLVKLGEIPPEGQSQRRRTLTSVSQEDSERFLSKLRKTWPSVAPNPLQVMPEEQFSPPEPDSDGQVPLSPQFRLAPEEPEPRTLPEQRTLPEPGLRPISSEPQLQMPAFDPLLESGGLESTSAEMQRNATDSLYARDTSLSPSNTRVPVRPVAVQQGHALPVEAKVDPKNAPVEVTRDGAGNLVVTSDDLQALDLLEDLVDELLPPRKDYRVFQLRHASAQWVAQNLTDFFKEGEDKPNNNRPYWYWDSSPSNQDKKERSRLSNRKPLKFIHDLDSNTILVSGGDASQLQTVSELIEIYDQPESPDAQAARVTGIFHLQYSKASVVADVIKEVYRDLLSANDKALSGQKEEQKQRPEAQNTYITNLGAGESEEKKTRVSFKGKISIGVDELSNTLIVSTEGENLLTTITQMIRTLDQAAEPVSSVKLLKLSGSLNTNELRGSLGRMLGSASGTSSPVTPSTSNGGQARGDKNASPPKAESISAEE